MTYTLPNLGFAVEYYQEQWISLCDKDAVLATIPEQLKAINMWKRINKQKYERQAK